jgi:hypothetical protein
LLGGRINFRHAPKSQNTVSKQMSKTKEIGREEKRREEKRREEKRREEKRKQENRTEQTEGKKQEM